MEWRGFGVFRVCVMSGLLLATAAPVFAQNSGAGLETIGPGRRVAAVWEPEHTFVVPKEGTHAAASD